MRQTLLEESKEAGSPGYSWEGNGAAGERGIIKIYFLLYKFGVLSFFHVFLIFYLFVLPCII